MWRSLAVARRCATSRSIGNLVLPKVNHFNFSSSLNPSRLFYSTHPTESAGDLPSYDPSISLINQQIEDNIEELEQQSEDNIEELEQNPLCISSEVNNDNVIEEVEVEVGEKTIQELDLKQLDSVLSLLQSSSNPDDGLFLESTLDDMNLTSLSEDFVVRVLKTPLIRGRNLIGFFKWAMKKTESFSPTSRSLEALVGAVSGQKLAYAVWDLIKEIGEKSKNDDKNQIMTTYILNGLISHLSKFGKAKAALEVFDKFDELGCVPDSDTYYITVDVLCRRSFYDWACVVVEKMISSGKLPEGERVGMVINYLCKGEKTKEAHSVYLLAKEKNKCPPRSTVNFLINSLSRGDKTVRLALEMLSDIPEDERKLAIKPFSSVISGLCKIKDLSSAKDLLSKMIEKGPPPGNAVFNSFINACSKGGDMEEAKNVMKLMESRGLKPDVFTYTVIISGYAKGGEMEEACKVLDEAKKKHSKLSTATFHTLVRGYCKLGEFDKAVKLLREMKEFGVEPNVDEYDKLIQTLCTKALDWETAEKLAEEMEANGLHLNGDTKALLRAVKEVGEEGAGSGEEEAVAV